MQKIWYCNCDADLAIPQTLTMASLTHTMNLALHHLSSPDTVLYKVFPPCLTESMWVGFHLTLNIPRKDVSCQTNHLSVSLRSAGKIRHFKNVTHLNYFGMRGITPYKCHVLTLVSVKEGKDDEFRCRHWCSNSCAQGLAMWAFPKEYWLHSGCQTKSETWFKGQKMSRRLNKQCNLLTATSLMLKFLNIESDLVNKANNICHSTLRKQLTEWQILVDPFWRVISKELIKKENFIFIRFVITMKTTFFAVMRLCWNHCLGT